MEPLLHKNPRKKVDETKSAHDWLFRLQDHKHFTRTFSLLLPIFDMRSNTIELSDQLFFRSDLKYKISSL